MKNGRYHHKSKAGGGGTDRGDTGYNLLNSIQYVEKNVPGLDGPIGQYIAGNSTTFNVTFIFDTYTPPTLENPQESGTDVTEYTKKIAGLTQIDGTLHREIGRAHV